MNIYIVLLPMISMLLGLYLVCLGLWELRVGIDRKRFITYSFTGLFLIFILPNMFGFFNLIINNLLELSSLVEELQLQANNKDLSEKLMDDYL